MSPSKAFRPSRMGLYGCSNKVEAGCVGPSGAGEPLVQPAILNK